MSTSRAKGLMTQSLVFVSTHLPMTQFQNQFPVNTAGLVAQADRVSSCGVQVALRQNFLRFLRCSCANQTCKITPHTLTRPTSQWDMTARVFGSSVTPDLALVWTPSNVTFVHSIPGLNNTDANLQISSSTPDRSEWPAPRFFRFRHKEKSPW